MSDSKKTIQIRGARTHNLKNIDLDLPRDKLIVISGLSGSGKSSLAFDTIFAEGQRRYVESLSSYARQFLSVMDKPDVDHIEGLSPAISIEQKSTSHNPRSTVGTITEIYDYLRLLFARVGTPVCPTHGESLEAQTIGEMVDLVLAMPEDRPMMLLAPIARASKGDHATTLEQLKAQGYVRARINGELVELAEPIKLNARSKHDIDVVIDRFKVRPDIALRLAESFETAVQLGGDTAIVAPIPKPSNKATKKKKSTKKTNESAIHPADIVFSSRYACKQCGYSMAELEPRSFSFNSPQGACPDCDGLGSQQRLDQDRLISDESLSIAKGAIIGWDKRFKYYFQMIQCLADHYQFDVDAPYNTLPKKIRNVLMHGSGTQQIRFKYIIGNKDGARERTHPFEGIAPNLNRRYRETESSTVREEISKLMSISICASCNGERLCNEARHVLIEGRNLPQLTALSIADSSRYLSKLRIKGQKAPVAAKILSEINQRLTFLIDVGLNYLALDRPAASLSGGEAQRIRLASQIGAGLMGVMYVLDEPSIGLHQRDNGKLIKTLLRLKELGNTVIVVEHDQEAIEAADYLVDIGPGAGAHGGHIVAKGSLKSVMRNKASPTGRYLSGRDKIEIPTRCQPTERRLSIVGANGNNLKNVDTTIPIGLFTCVTGVSGSGKSTLINNTLYRYVSQQINKAHHQVAPVTSIQGLEHIEAIVDINQSPIGRTPRSNPATYTGLFTVIRELFAGTPEARSRGYKSGRFSFNVKGGRCEACQGDGLLKVEMHFLPDVYVQCDVCNGKRYNRETLDIRYKGKSIDDILNLTVEEGLEFFTNVPVLKRKLDTLNAVGLSYITLGQNATTLSGGEAQRIKLSRELSKRDTGTTLYILDEPTTGLHFADVKQLLAVLHQLRDNGNTILVIEHNLDVIKTADWVIDMGPDGGDGGGTIVTSGTPEHIVQCKSSHTGHYLKALL